MDDAARGVDGFDVEALLECLKSVPQPLPSAEDDGHDDNVHVVDQVGGKELSDGGRASADADVESARRFLGDPEGLDRARVNEVKRRAASHLDRGTGVVGEDEHGRMKWWVVAPPALPLLVSPRSALGSELVSAHDLDTDAGIPVTSEGVVDPGASTWAAREAAL